MKKILLLLIVFSFCINAQNTKFAWINNPQVASPKQLDKLSEMIKIINAMEGYDFVLVTGSITDKGKNIEFNKVKMELGKSLKDYEIIPGANDVVWSQTAGDYFKNIWLDDKFIHESDSIVFIGLNTLLPFNEKLSYIKATDIDWLEDELKKIPNGKEIVFITSAELNKNTRNIKKMLDVLRSRDVVLNLTNSPSDNDNGIFNSIGVKSSIDKEGWNFNDVQISNDSLTVTNINHENERSVIFNNTIPSAKEIKLDEFEMVNHSAELLMEKETGQTLVAETLISESKIYTAAYDGIVTCYDSSGTKLWDYDTFGNIVSKPAITDNILVVGTLQGDLLTLDATEGTTLQSIGFDESITSDMMIIDYKGSMDIIIEENVESRKAVIIGASSGNFYCYHLSTLQELWINTEAENMISAKPLQIGNNLIFTSWDGHIYSVDARKGWMIWKWPRKSNFHKSAGGSDLVTNGSRIFAASKDNVVSAIDARLGSTLWQNDDLDASFSIGISKDSKKLFVKSENEKVYVVSPGNGKLIKRINIDYGNDFSANKLTEIDGIVPFGADNGRIYRVNNRYYYKTLLEFDNTRFHSVQKYKEDILFTSSINGKLLLFKVVD